MYTYTYIYIYICIYILVYTYSMLSKGYQVDAHIARWL